MREGVGPIIDEFTFGDFLRPLRQMARALRDEYPGATPSSKRGRISLLTQIDLCRHSSQNPLCFKMKAFAGSSQTTPPERLADSIPQRRPHIRDFLFRQTQLEPRRHDRKPETGIANARSNPRITFQSHREFGLYRSLRSTIVLQSDVSRKV